MKRALESAGFKIPREFRSVRYNAASHPGRPGLKGFKHGANCQHFACELLRHFGYEVPNLRSSELAADTKHFTIARRLRPFDLILFNRSETAWGAHVGIYLGNARVLHLCKAAGHPETWTLARFAATPAYKVRVIAKRLTRKIDPKSITGSIRS